MNYWTNIFAMTGSACLAVAFIELEIYTFICGLFCVYVGKKLQKKGV